MIELELEFVGSLEYGLCLPGQIKMHFSQSFLPRRGHEWMSRSVLQLATYPPTHSTTMDESPFGKLPAELRNRIYECLLEDGVQYCITTYFNERGVAKLKASLAEQPLALARTCRATHSEFTPLFYSSNTFMIRSRAGTGVLKSFDVFTKMIGHKNARSLRHVIFRVLEQRMESFESVCSTHMDVKLILEQTMTASREQYRQCQFRVQVDLVHCSRAPANATFLLDLDFDRLEQSVSKPMGKRVTRPRGCDVESYLAQDSSDVFETR